METPTGSTPESGPTRRVRRRPPPPHRRLRRLRHRAPAAAVAASCRSHRPSSWEAPEDQAGPAPGLAFGGAGERLVAYIVDILIIAGLVLLVVIVGAVIVGRPAGAGAIVVWIVGLIGRDPRVLPVLLADRRVRLPG